MNRIIIDLDNTLYPEHKGIFSQVNNRINLYLEEKMKFRRDTINSMRVEYMEKYGTTLRGLMIHHHVDPGDYLKFVHDVEIESVLSGNKALDDFLHKLKGEKILFTNGAYNYAMRILNSLCVAHHFNTIFDIVSIDYIAKPDSYGYKKLIALTGNGSSCNYLFIDDRPDNIRTAKELGMLTVLVSANGAGDNCNAELVVREITELEDKLKGTVFI
ncbi:MAG: pyrimidine 5'-nucleotidase [Candidatus Schekmanbacteria bacterium]|nr:pyrimidine 5'-nucleotidase [Candidatus Schekmanbacteria bacterium]